MMKLIINKEGIMPILDCSRDNQNGKKFGNDGFCFVGNGAQEKAEAQGRALNLEINKKGIAGKDTGASARAAIQKAIDGGHSLDDIGRVAKRSASVISQIRSGEIANPPPELVSAIRGMKAKPKPKA